MKEKKKDASMLELKSLPLNVHDKTKETRKQHQQNIQSSKKDLPIIP
jgi:hypothetical protein